MTNPDSDGLFDNDWDDCGELSWSEADWQKYLANQETAVREYIKHYDQLPATMDRIDEAARRMGWELAEVPEAIVGLGTLLAPADLERAVALGARFAVSPGATPELLAAAASSRVLFLPGVATPSEAMRARDAGFALQKFFPAEAAGGVAALRSLAAPLPGLAFCPTGGIGPHNVRDYLALPNVVAAGGSWLAHEGELVAAAWARIRDRAAEARRLASG